MHFYYLILLSIYIPLINYGQNIIKISESVSSDSSFYHIARIMPNEYWIGGEFGIMKRIDTLGNMENINYPNLGYDILKIERVNDFVLIATSNGIIYKYCLNKKVFTTHYFVDLKGKCIYDFISLDNGTIMLCGGNSGIAKARKKIPRGFIASTSLELSNLNIEWKNCRMFPWSMLPTSDSTILAVAFNGFSSKTLLKSNGKWKSVGVIKGLIHQIIGKDSIIYYVGTKNIKYWKDGIWASSNDKNKQNISVNTGCIWSIKSLNNIFLGVTNSGEIIFFDPVTNRIIHKFKVAENLNIYELEIINKEKIIVVGHAKSVYIVDLSSLNTLIEKGE